MHYQEYLVIHSGFFQENYDAPNALSLANPVVLFTTVTATFLEYGIVNKYSRKKACYVLIL
jgi:hypothetical protein